MGRNGSGVYVTADGPGIARDRRRSATLSAFGESARRALAAGHGEGELVEELGRIMAQGKALAVSGTGDSGTGDSGTGDKEERE